MTTAIATTTTRHSIDKAHSEIAFQVRHLLTKIRGRFSDFNGTIEYDDEHPERSLVHVEVQAASIDTGDRDRDAHLRSADFFDVEKIPSITFRSTGIERKADGSFVVTGELTIHAMTRLVSFDASVLGKAKDPWGNERTAFEAETTVNRKDFGLTWNAALETGGFLVGDEVTITVSVQAIPARA